MPSTPALRYPWLWRILLGLFMAGVVLAGIAAVGCGITIVWGPLGSPP